MKISYGPEFPSKCPESSAKRVTVRADGEWISDYGICLVNMDTRIFLEIRSLGKTPISCVIELISIEINFI